MTKYQPATPYTDSIKRPDCPHCGTRMMLARLQMLVRDQPGYESRTFECPKCDSDVTETVKVS